MPKLVFHICFTYIYIHMYIYMCVHTFYIHINSQVNNKLFSSFSLKDQLILCHINVVQLSCYWGRPGDRKTSFKEKDLKYHLKI